MVGRASASRGDHAWRRRAAAGLFVLTAVVAVVPSARGLAVARAAPGAVGCAVPAPRTAEGYQAMFDEQWGGWGAADGAHSIPLPDGRTMWTFNDTIQGEPDARGAFLPGWRMITNSVVIQDEGCLAPVLGPGGADSIPAQSNGDRFWPTNGIAVGDRVYLHAHRIRYVDQALFPFDVVGSDLAVFEIPVPGGIPVFREIIRTPSSRWGEPGADVAWGVAMWSDGTDLYLYGIRGREAGFGNELHVARVAIDQIDDPSAWRYRTADGWSADPSASVQRIADGTYLEGMSVGPYGAGVVVVSKEDGFFGDEVHAWTAPAPDGPFTRQAALTLPALNTDRYWYYTANHHPQIRLASGRTLASISRNTGDLRDVLAEATLYKPQFREEDLGVAADPAVPLSIDAAVWPAAPPARSTISAVVTANGAPAYGRPVEIRYEDQVIARAHTDARGVATAEVSTVASRLQVTAYGGPGQAIVTTFVDVVPPPP